MGAFDKPFSKPLNLYVLQMWEQKRRIVSRTGYYGENCIVGMPRQRIADHILT